MRELGKILVVSQHYPPDPTTTATYIGDIARALAADCRVVVLSGSRNSAARAANPEVIEIAAAAAPKDALVRRAIAISWLAIRMFCNAAAGRAAGRGVLRHHALHPALRRDARGKAAGCGDRAADLRSLSRSAAGGRTCGTVVADGAADPPRQRHAVPPARCDHHHRPRRGAAAARLSRRGAGQNPFHSELDSAAGRLPRRRARDNRFRQAGKHN